MRLSRRQALGVGGGLAALATGCARNERQAEETDLAKIDAIETAARISRGDLSAEEAINAAIARAEKVEPEINAIVAADYDGARATAAGAANGPWWGVPSFVKDLTDVAGQPTGYGARGFAGYVASGQFPFVDDFFNTGLISLGKSSTPEFGLTATTEPLSSGPTRNPWNLDHSVGGSSGGAAALVAAGVVPVAHASDGGGSIRIPASCCGVVGLKATRGRFNPSRASNMPLSISINGIESRTVRDTAAFLAMMEVEAGGPAPVGMVSAPGKERLRIGYFTITPGGQDAAPEVIAATLAAAETCSDLGHDVSEFAPAIGEQLEADFVLYWAFMADSVLGLWERIMQREAGGDAFENLTLGLRDHYRQNTDELGPALERLESFSQDYARIFEDYDVLLSPVTTTPAPKIGHLGGDLDYELAMGRLSAFARYTSVQNITGAPAISLPLGQSSNGLPIGTMFAGPVGGERRLLELAYALEEAAPWINRAPPLFASGV